MIIFSTKLYVKNTLTDDLFVNMSIEWVKNSQNYSFGDLSWNQQEEYYAESIDKMQTLTIIKYDNTVMVRLINNDKKVQWTNDYVLTTRGDKRVLSVQLYRDTEDVSISLPTKFNRPKLLKDIMRDGYGDIDNNLETNDKCLIITEENIDIIKKIILDEEEYMMPIVHVTPQFRNSQFVINYDELAKDLAGVAHVLVDKNNLITNQLKELTCGRNPYNAGVQIYFCKGVNQRILPYYVDGTFRFRIAYTVFQRLALSKIDDDLSWSKLRIKRIIDGNEQSQKEHNELMLLYDEEIRNNENEIKVLRDQVHKLETDLTVSRAKADSLEMHFDNAKTEDSCLSGIVLSSQEYDFFEDEQKYIVLKTLEKEVKSMSCDQNQKETRKYHILNSIIQQNVVEDNSVDMISEFRRVFADNAQINANTKRAIRLLGFDIEESKHYKFTYKDDSRYLFTAAKTPGDGRTMKNLRGKILRVLFDMTD